jgi:Holliday junction DNA helicase RuvA
MIGRLRGTLIEQEDTYIVIECGGVGYEVHVSMNTLLTLPAVGEEVTLRVFTQMLDARIALYGFGSAFERDLFDLLITAKKVGPSSAMGILSGGASPVDIARMIAGKEIGMLTKIRGVGKKTAEMLVVELHDKCEMLLAVGQVIERMTGVRPVPAVRPPPQRPDRPEVLSEVASALVQLGWRPAEADKAVADLVVTEDATLESLLRRALRSMPR